MSDTLSPARTVPAGLDFDPVTDPARRRHLLLGAPWNARVHPDHESKADRIRRDDFVVDRSLLASGLSVTVNHDVRRKVGRIVDASTDEVGLWIVVDLDPEGERVLADDGRVSIDVIQPRFRWLLSGVALLTPDSEQGIAGAEVVFSAGGERQFWVEPVTSPSYVGASIVRDLAKAAGLAGAGGRAVLNPLRAPDPAPYRPDMVVNLGERKAFTASMSMRRVADDVAYDRARWEERRTALADAENSRTEQMLMAAGVPASEWPLWTSYRQSWESTVHSQLVSSGVDAAAGADATLTAAYETIRQVATEARALGELHLEKGLSWVSRFRRAMCR